MQEVLWTVPEKDKYEGPIELVKRGETGTRLDYELVQDQYDYYVSLWLSKDDLLSLAETILQKFRPTVDPNKKCPTCQGLCRETTGMVCQTCGRDYMQPDPQPTKAF